MLIQCHQPRLPVDLSDTSQWSAWDKIVADELPALAFAIDNFEVPKAIITARYGVKAWHDPKLVEMEREAGVEQQLLDIIINDLPSVFIGDAEWTGTSVELERILLGGSMPSISQSRKLLSWSGACGTYLGRMSKTHPTRLTRRRVKGVTQWRINLK
jgi:hypothetical protein